MSGIGARSSVIAGGQCRASRCVGRSRAQGEQGREQSAASTHTGNSAGVPHGSSARRFSATCGPARDSGASTSVDGHTNRRAEGCVHESCAGWQVQQAWRKMRAIGRPLSCLPLCVCKHTRGTLPETHCHTVNRQQQERGTVMHTMMLVLETDSRGTWQQGK